MSGYSQFSLLTQRRFLPYFTVQALGSNGKPIGRSNTERVTVARSGARTGTTATPSGSVDRTA